MTQLTYTHEHGTRTLHYSLTDADGAPLDSGIADVPPILPRRAALTYHAEEGSPWELSRIRLRGPRSKAAPAVAPGAQLHDQSYFVGPGDHFWQTAPAWVRALAERHRRLPASHPAASSS
ncbi:hypothetical protein ACIQU4_28590 [Streptomyces sp. NPDC090741]|uniref:hypothetical protein n=1 Tax=Streptomyces sp. NPDC090741 TaxID=3365967 RepID=UPI003829229F